MDISHSGLTRRQFIGSSGMVAAATLAGAEVAHGDTATVEKANEKLVLDMCKKIETVDVAQLAPYLADDFVFQLIDGQPLIKGKDTFLQFVGQFFSPFERAEFIVHRSHAMGNLVINERTDNFFAKEGGTNQSFHVTGFCLVKDGKIQEWKDYGLPE